MSPELCRELLSDFPRETLGNLGFLRFQDLIDKGYTTDSASDIIEEIVNSFEKAEFVSKYEKKNVLKMERAHDLYKETLKESDVKKIIDQNLNSFLSGKPFKNCVLTIIKEASFNNICDAFDCVSKTEEHKIGEIALSRLIEAISDELNNNRTQITS